MAKAVLMPQAGISVESCIITEWRKKPGDSVAVGDILFSYETDKASFECESTEAGTLLEIFYQDGDEVPVLVSVCAVGAPGEDVSSLRPQGGGGQTAAAEPAKAGLAEAAQPPRPAAASAAAAAAGEPVLARPLDADREILISPRARRLAERQGVDARMLPGSGPGGRIIERDVRAAVEKGAAATAAAYGAVAASAPGSFAGTGLGGRVRAADLAGGPVAVAPADAAAGTEYADVRFTGIRKAISKSMTQSLSTIPQLTHHFSFDAGEMLAYRKKLKSGGEGMGLGGVTLGDMILYAVSRLLPRYPDLNAHMLDGTTIRRFRDVNLGFACDTERGLMVPVIRQANRKSLREISDEVKALAKEAQSGSISPDKLGGGTFTVSNLGALGVESFTPVINPPQVGILGVDNIVQRPYEQDGAIKLYPAMGLSMTYDHRAIDGAPLSRFMQELCKCLENFTMLLAQ